MLSFDNLEHGHLRQFLQLRVRDGVLLRLIDKWLKAGVMEDGNVSPTSSVRLHLAQFSVFFGVQFVVSRCVLAVAWMESMGTGVGRRCSEDLELGNQGSIRTISGHVHSPVLSQQGWKATRLLGTRGIVSDRARPATTGRLLSRSARRRRSLGGAASSHGQIEESSALFAVWARSFGRGFA